MSEHESEKGGGERGLQLEIPFSSEGEQVGILEDTPEDNGYADKSLYSVSVERYRALKNMDPGGTRSALGGEGLRWALKNIDPKVGQSYDAHGVGLKEDPVAVLDRILSQGFDLTRPLYTMNFMDVGEAGNHFGADHPFTEGGVIFVSHPKQKLTDGVGYVVLGEEYARAVSLLRAKYPDVRFVPWNEATSVLTDAYNSATGETATSTVPDEQNRPTYPTRDTSPGGRFKNDGDDFQIPMPSDGDSKHVDEVW